MALNSYFNNFTSTSEQALLDALTVESIQIFGHAIYYIPRVSANVDDVWVEDTSVTYSTNYLIEMFVSATEGYSGEQDFLSKFGPEIRDEFEVQVSKTTFDTIVGAATGKAQPQEGDLIYVPMSNDLFKITFVEDEPIFYQLGALYLFELRLEKYEYSEETFNTGITALDAWANSRSHNVLDPAIALEAEDDTVLTFENGQSITLESYNIATTDPLAQNDVFQEEADEILDFSELDPFAETGRY